MNASLCDRFLERSGKPVRGCKETARCIGRCRQLMGRKTESPAIYTRANISCDQQDLNPLVDLTLRLSRNWLCIAPLETRRPIRMKSRFIVPAAFHLRGSADSGCQVLGPPPRPNEGNGGVPNAANEHHPRSGI